MIVKMKKVTLFILESLKDEALESLKKLGLVHIEPLQGSGESLEALQSDYERKQAVLNSLPVAKDGDTDELSGDAANEAFRTAEELVEQRKQFVQDLADVREDIDLLKPYGSFDSAFFDELENEGWFINVYEMSDKEFRNLDTEHDYVVVLRDKKQVRIAVVSKELPDWQWNTLHFPKKPLSHLLADEQRLIRLLHDTNAQLAELARHSASLQKALNVLADTINFENVRTGLAAEDDIAYFTGFVPENTVEDLKAYASKEGIGLSIREPEPEDKVPTLVERPKPVRIIKPVFDLMGTVPGYREIDISLMFLLAFGFFVAMIVGDAAYGFIMLLGTIFLQLKSRKKPGLVFGLFVYLSSTTIVWGTITGTWFGSEALSQVPFFQQFVIPEIASYAPSGVDAIQNIMLLCFVAGLLHLSLARVEAFVRKLPSLAALEHLGWLITLQGLFILVLDLVIGVNELFGVIVTPFILPLIIPGLVLVILFGKQEGDVAKGFLFGIAFSPLTFLDAVSAFSDIISYVRLFAVGLASVAVAESFNIMASGAPAGLNVFILFGGHTLNLVMAFMSIAVHGLRLNMLEYSGHLGLEWSGYEYKPFRETA